MDVHDSSSYRLYGLVILHVKIPEYLVMLAFHYSPQVVFIQLFASQDLCLTTQQPVEIFVPIVVFPLLFGCLSLRFSQTILFISSQSITYTSVIRCFYQYDMWSWLFCELVREYWIQMHQWAPYVFFLQLLPGSILINLTFKNDVFFVLPTFLQVVLTVHVITYFHCYFTAIFSTNLDISNLVILFPYTAFTAHWSLTFFSLFT